MAETVRASEDDSKTNINVFIRTRPLRSGPSCIEGIEKDDKSINLKKDFEIRKFKFSHIFRDVDDQEHVFKKTAMPILDSVIQGYNGCIMAYGQTGTGKTHTILGKRDGLLPKCLEYIFFRDKHSDERFVVDISCLQIYMENLTDLFDYKRKSIQIREKNGTFFVTNNIWVRLNNFDEAVKVIEETENRRKSCSTNMNMFSSRSHAIFIIKVTNIKNLTSSNLFLVDLAGSERIKKSYAQGDRLDEAISINTSLMALSKCIYGISENKWNHIPYRESKLTKILQETLAGNGKTVIIITISPDNSDIEETISSLKFGQRASKIYCTPKICKIENDYLTNNMFILDDQKKILEEENLHLREQCKKLLKIVETTATKTIKQPMRMSEQDCQEVSKDLKDLLDRDSEDHGHSGLVTRQEYERIMEENKQLKVRIDEVELEAFDSMRITYEEIENNLYGEINEHKQTIKKLQKSLASLTKKHDEATKELDTKNRELSSIKKSESKASLRSTSTVSQHDHSQRDLTLKSQDSAVTFSLPGEAQEIQVSMARVFEEFQSTKSKNLEDLKARLASIIRNPTSLKENILSQSDSRIELNDTQEISVSPLRSALQERKLNTNKTIEQSLLSSVEISVKNLEVSPAASKQSELEESYRSATQEQKKDAGLKMIKVLEGLVADIDRKCCSLVTTSSNEDDALENILKRITGNLTSFVGHGSFSDAMNELTGSRISLLKVAINTIIEDFVKKLVSLRFAENKASHLSRQNKFLKGIIFSEEIKDACLEVIRLRHLTLKSAITVQRAYRKYRWRKNYNKSQRTSGMFDWGRVRAAMGKENLQILLGDVESIFESISKTLA